MAMQKLSKVILTLNTGSSSIKFRLFKISDELELLHKGSISAINTDPVFKWDDESQKLQQETDHHHALEIIINKITAELKGYDLVAVGHRVVCGGEHFTKPVIIDNKNLEIMRSLNPLVPLHQPHNLDAIDILAEKYPSLTQIACFDNSFHQTIAPINYEYPLPKNIKELGDNYIRRYGYHGLSFAWIAHQIKNNYPELVSQKIIAAHIGNGVSICAMQNAQSVATTMGMTALDGTIMGTRIGAIDPGILLYLLREQNITPNELEDILYKKSGLYGLSGLSNDLRDLEEASERGNHDAQFAIDYFAQNIAEYIAKMSVKLNGVDAIIFTGGIGENSEMMRTKILQHLSWLGDIDIHVIATNEEKMIAIYVCDLIASSASDQNPLCAAS